MDVRMALQEGREGQQAGADPPGSVITGFHEPNAALTAGSPRHPSGAVASRLAAEGLRDAMPSEAEEARSKFPC